MLKVCPTLTKAAPSQMSRSNSHSARRRCLSSTVSPRRYVQDQRSTVRKNSPTSITLRICTTRLNARQKPASLSMASMYSGVYGRSNGISIMCASITQACRQVKSTVQGHALERSQWQRTLRQCRRKRRLDSDVLQLYARSRERLLAFRGTCRQECLPGIQMSVARAPQSISMKA